MSLLLILVIKPMGQAALQGCLSHTCMHFCSHAYHLHMCTGSHSPLSFSPSLLSGPVEKPHLYDDIQHRIKAHVRPSSAYAAAAKRGSIQPHTLMQPCTHTGRDTTASTHTHTHTVSRQAQTCLWAHTHTHKSLRPCCLACCTLVTPDQRISSTNTSRQTY